MTSPQNYEQFKGCMMILMHFDDRLGTTQIEELCQGWYTNYKANPRNYDDVLTWAHEYFEDDLRDRSAHWVNPSGHKLLQLSDAFDKLVKGPAFIRWGAITSRDHQDD